MSGRRARLGIAVAGVVIVAGVLWTAPWNALRYGRVDPPAVERAGLESALARRIEEATGAPVVTSNTAPLWYLLSKLGRRYSVKGVGRLLSEWPALPAE